MRTIETDIFGREVRDKQVNSKVKGNRNELQAAKFMEKWTGRKWTRTPSSGGLRWKNAPNVCGDIVCEEADFISPVSVETKHLKNIHFAPNLGSRSKVATIFKQAKEDADRASKLPMLLLRQNGMPSGEFVVYLTVRVNCSCISYGEVSGVKIFGFKSEDLLSAISFNDIDW